LVKQPLQEVWRCLTQGHRLTRWFADSADLVQGRPFRFDFGDGDFFAGDVTEWDAPCRLGLQWRFMAIGPLFQILLELEPKSPGETMVRVTDRGSRTQADADSLTEGWVDFLSRLERHARKGEWARYDWSEDIGTTAVVSRSPREVIDLVGGEGWWQRNLAPPKCIDRRADGAAAEFASESWAGNLTVATVRVKAEPGGSYVEVRHAGWGALPEGIRMSERRRFAELWAATLMKMEAAWPATSTGPQSGGAV
jgi:uncharacterized protein YndB with AHSA1/START domain